MPKKVKFGLSNVHYAVYDESTGKYAAPVAAPGARSFTADYEGDTSNFYADNIVYYTHISSSSISGSLELADTEDQMRIDLLGDIKDKATGLLLEDLAANAKEFALLGEIDGDPKSRRFVYYSCKLSRPSSEANTKEDSVSPDTDTFNFTAIGRSMKVLGETRVISKGVCEPGDAAYAAFFDAVKMPTEVVSGASTK